MIENGPRSVVPGVFVVGGPDITDPADCLVYAVDGGTEIALIDCGAGESVADILDNVERVGLDPSRLTTLILTHCHVDHIGGVPEILGRCAPKVVCHTGDADALEAADDSRTAASWYGLRLPPIRVDLVLRGEEDLVRVGKAGLRCIHTPGHTPGSISLVLETPWGRVLFGQDIHGPFMREFGSDLGQWAASMRRLLALRADVLCEGHFGVFRPAEEVERFIRGHLRQHGFS